MKRYDGLKAWKNLLSEKERHFSHGLDRFNQSPLMVAHEPKFQIAPDSVFFCIGSCFARNVEEYLIYNDVKVTSRNLKVLRSETTTRCPNGIVNKFTTASMLNELRWAAEPPKNVDLLLTIASEDKVDDLHLHPGIPSLSLERARARRMDLSENYFSRALKADVVVLTLGLDEAWYDLEAEIHLNAAPSFWSCRRSLGRYALDVLDFRHNLEALHEIRAVLKAANPNVQIVVTVSPVPLAYSFSILDVAVAGMRAKSTLRSAAQSFADAYDDVDYFPSYEMVMLAPRNASFIEDCLHVSDKTVGAIIRSFIRLYMGKENSGEEGFVDALYLEANPDVADAVFDGRFDSGYHHWVEHGRSEGRPIALPPDRRDPRLFL